MNTAALLSKMADDHLLAVLHAQRNPLTVTPAEDELLKRFERLLDEAHERGAYTQVLINEFDFDEYAPLEELIRLRALLDFATSFGDEYQPLDAAGLTAVLGAHPATNKDLAAMLSLLNQHDIYTPDQLEKLITCASEFRAIAQDAGDAIARLATLVTAANQE